MGENRLLLDDMARKVNVLFCCLGNICRSPLAEAVFLDYVNRNGLRERFGVIDSCGTANYHEGEEPDPRTVAICRANDIPINSLARGVEPADFDKFDFIFGMECVAAVATWTDAQLEQCAQLGQGAAARLQGTVRGAWGKRR